MHHNKNNAHLLAYLDVYNSAELFHCVLLYRVHSLCSHYTQWQFYSAATSYILECFWQIPRTEPYMFNVYDNHSQLTWWLSLALVHPCTIISPALLYHLQKIL